MQSEAHFNDEQFVTRIINIKSLTSNMLSSLTSSTFLTTNDRSHKILVDFVSKIA